MISLYDYIKNAIDKLEVITIDQAFIDYRNQMTWKFNTNGRTEQEKLINCDALILEYSLIQKALASPAKCREHDFIFSEFNAKIDAKKIEKWFNITDDKIAWYNRNYKLGEVTHFCFFKYTNKLRPFQVGDTVKVDLLDVVSVEEVLRNVIPSNFKGYYYIVKNNFTYN
jgi:hypothetical protein